ncbi:MAG: ABC transporter permease [Gemmatimonadales bacterium]|nr:MAG: ABC transporter permease [Gemmatimonadales bacterium]
MGDLRSLGQLTLSRLRVMLREPEIIFWVFAFPLLLAIGLGVAFSDPMPDTPRVAIESGSGGERFIDALRADPEIEIRILGVEEASDALRRGEVSLVIAGDETTLQFRYDPTRAEARTARLAAERSIQREAGGPAPVTIRPQEVEQLGHRYIDWLIPGIIGFNLMSTGLWGIGFYITQSRQNRQLKRLIATPMPRGHFLLAQILARFVFLIGEIPLLILAAWLLFDVPMAGGIVSLAVVVLIGAASFCGLGLLASSRTRTTEGASGIINAIVMPMVVLCGVFFSTARFPDAMQPLIRILPLTPLNDALRAVYNDGLAFTAVAGELALLATWGIVAFVLALRWFRWQ